MSDRPKKRWGLLPWSLVAGVVLLGGMLAASLMAEAEKTSNQSKAVNNCKRIIGTLKVYAYTAGAGGYPSQNFEDGTKLNTANQVFRALAQEGLVEDERIFGCPDSIFSPDGLMGSPPVFRLAVQSGENHWMVLEDQTDTSVGNTPLIIENALNVSWPPRWDASERVGEKRGRAWKGRQIIIGQLDGSVTLEALHADGTLALRTRSAVWHWVDMHARDRKALPSYLDIEERKAP